MTWFTELSLAFLLALCIHGKFAVGHPTPLESLDTVGAFINNFTSSAGQTIEDIIKTSVYTMREAGKTSSSTLQALNMAFASSLAEIAVSELGGANIPSRKWRKIQQLGLSRHHKDRDSPTGRWQRYCFDLTYLGPEDVEVAFFLLIGNQTSEVMEFSDYLAKNYIDVDDNTPYPLSMWAADSSDLWRTTNSCESFHSRMQSLQGRVMTLQDIGSVKINNRDDLYDLLEVMNENFQECTIHLLLSNGADVDDELNSILDEGIINTCTLLCAENMLPEFGANANDCVGFLDKIMPVAKLLIQYILIKRISNAEPEPNLADFSTYSSLLSLKLYHNFPFYDELVAYKQGCLKELNAMKGEGISENYTLFSYINEQCCTAKVNEDDLKTFLTKKVLSKFNQYPYCKDLIIASLKKSCILEELCNEKIYTWQQISDCSLEKYKVNLNSDTIQALAPYLSESDMINLTLAYRECYEVSLESTEVLNGM